MTPLVRFLIVNFAGGFALGLGTGFVWVTMQHGGGLLFDEPLAAAMMLWSFAAPFGAGALGTGLALLPHD